MELCGVVVGIADLEGEECGFSGSEGWCGAQVDFIRKGHTDREQASIRCFARAAEVFVADRASIDATDAKWKGSGA